MSQERISINVQCPYCKTTGTAFVMKEGYLKWKSGAYIQDAFPDLASEQREMLLTGICPMCWDKMFKKEN